MFKHKALLVAALAVLLGVCGACTNDTLDDGDGADIIMEVLVLDNPAVTASLDQATNVCTFTIEDWRADVSNEPKNELALAPYNDLELIRLTIQYQWIDGGLSTPTRIVGLGGIVVPASTSSQVAFTPIAFDDLNLGVAGHTANLIMTFEARTIEGTIITKTVLRQLNVEPCS